MKYWLAMAKDYIERHKLTNADEDTLAKAFCAFYERGRSDEKEKLPAPGEEILN